MLEEAEAKKRDAAAKRSPDAPAAGTKRSLDAMAAGDEGQPDRTLFNRDKKSKKERKKERTTEDKDAEIFEWNAVRSQCRADGGEILKIIGITRGTTKKAIIAFFKELGALGAGDFQNMESSKPMTVCVAVPKAVYLTGGGVRGG